MSSTAAGAVREVGEDHERMAYLRTLSLLDPCPDAELSEIAELACALCDAPASSLAFVGNKEWLSKAVYGADVLCMPAHEEFCRQTLREAETLVVPDSLEDARFRHLADVAGTGKVRFYAGAVIRHENGLSLGSLCVMDVKPRAMRSAQLTGLKILARKVQTRLKLREQQLVLKAALREAEQARQRLEASERRFKMFMDASPLLSYLKDAEGRLLFYNRALAEEFGKDRQELLGKSDRELWPEQHATAYRRHDLEVLQSGKHSVQEEQNTDEQGRVSHWRSYKFPFTDADGGLRLGGVSINITEERARESKLQSYGQQLEQANLQLLKMATTDSLTGVANRRVFEARLSMDFSTARRKRRDLAVVMIDVDNFKHLNDSRGHVAGDAALCAIAEVLKGAVRAGDTVARYGGEEFVLLLPECDAQGAVAICHRIQEGLRQRGPARGPVTVSGGIAVLNPSHTSAHDLLMDADEALYAAKHAGKDCVMQHSCCSTSDLPMVWEAELMPQEAYCG